MAVTGPPGVGKSTFIEAFGRRLVGEGRNVAVLAVDPTSSLSRGSILGDKTRMPGLAAEANAFVRPSPSGSATGGIAQRTRETIVLVEAAGFDTVFVETVGVGQADVIVHTMVDFCLLLALAGAGDELQGMKRGIFELANAVAVTKSDDENVPAARRAQLQIRNALGLFPPASSGWQPPVHVCSAKTGEGLEQIWETVREFERVTRASGHFDSRRHEQARQWFRQTLDRLLREEFFGDTELGSRVRELENDVVTGRKSASEAAEAVIAYRRRTRSP